MWYDLLIIGNHPVAREIGMAAARRNQLIGWVEDPQQWLEETLSRQLRQSVVSQQSVTEWQNESESLRERTCEQLARQGIDVLSGVPRFTTTDGLELNLSGRKLTLKSTRILIATETEVLLSGRNGLASWCNTLSQRHQHLALMGGHMRDWELAVWLQRQGNRITFLIDQPVSQTSSEAVNGLVSAFQSHGGRVIPCQQLFCEGSTIRYQPPQQGRFQKLSPDTMIDLRNRVGKTRELHCEQARIGIDSKGKIWCDESMQSWNSQVYGLGDVVGFPDFSEKLQRKILRAELLEPEAGHGTARMSRSLLSVR